MHWRERCLCIVTAVPDVVKSGDAITQFSVDKTSTLAERRIHKLGAIESRRALAVHEGPEPPLKLLPCDTVVTLPVATIEGCVVLDGPPTNSSG